MTRVVIFVNFILICLSFTTATASTDDAVSAIASSNSSSSSNFTGAFSYAKSAAGSLNSSDPKPVCPKGKKKSSCPKDEVLSKCVTAVCKPQKCSDRAKKLVCPCSPKGSCKRGCICANGYLRNSKGRCIPEDKCPAGNCPTNERYSRCVQGECRALNCTQKGKAIACPLLAEGACKHGCVCVEGTLRAANGTCIPEDKCPVECPANEEFSNCTQAVCRSQTCKDKNLQLSCPAVEAGSCNRGCVCQSGYLRTEEGKCILENQCSAPFKCSQINEEFNSCPPICPSDDCSQASPTGRCPIFGSIGIVLKCEPNCRCIKGYWRNNGTCVPYSECPGKCPTNERYSRCVQGECRALNCTQKGKAIACPVLAEGACKQGCVCVEGTLRAANGTCVPEDKCPVVCPANEEFSNCTQSVCRCQTCKDKNLQTSCPKVEEGSCKSGCVCQFGYLRTEEGECVLENRCSGDLVCKDNEVVTSCPNSIYGDSCPKNETDAKSRTEPREMSECEEPSCTCRFNYKRNDNGTCIPTRDCPPFNCTGENEEFNPCPPFCPTDDCAQATPTGRCPLGRIGIMLQCRPNCRCKTGYWRKNGVCVPYAECPQKCVGQNEVITECPNSCSPIYCPDSFKEEQDRLQHCASADVCLPADCRCRTDYRRDANGKCIPIGECPGICPTNEQFSNCTQGLCRAQNCKQRGHPIACPEIEEGSCKKGCVCSSGFLRDDQGNCVAEDMCSYA